MGVLDRRGVGGARPAGSHQAGQCGWEKVVQREAELSGGNTVVQQSSQRAFS